MTARTCSSLMRRLHTTLSFMTTTPPLASAPIASSDQCGTPSLRTRNTSSSACRAAAASHAPGTAPAGQSEDQQAVLVVVGRQLLGQHTAGFPTVAEGASGRSPQKA